MTEIATKTFLEFAEAETSLFVQDELGCDQETRKVLTSLLAELPGLTEEGNQIWAFIIVTSNMKELESAVPTATFVNIESLPLTSSSLKSAFKSLAPICERPWYGWLNIDSKKDQIEYGVVNCENSQTSIAFNEHLSNGESWPANTILASPLSSSVLLLQGQKKG